MTGSPLAAQCTHFALRIGIAKTLFLCDIRGMGPVEPATFCKLPNKGECERRCASSALAVTMMELLEFAANALSDPIAHQVHQIAEQHPASGCW
jgi:hypothetical protein